jgi:outer membrane protein TolC
VAPVVTSLADRVAGLNFSASLRFALPVPNYAARGRLAQQLALVRAAALGRDELARTIGSAVSVALQALRAAALAADSSERAVAAYEEAVANERKKLRAGLSTNIDVILTESRLTAAELQVVRTEARVAEALTRLRFASGTLVTAGASGQGSVGLRELTTAP